MGSAHISRADATPAFLLFLRSRVFFFFFLRACGAWGAPAFFVFLHSRLFFFFLRACGTPWTRLRRVRFARISRADATPAFLVFLRSCIFFFFFFTRLRRAVDAPAARGVGAD